MVPWRGFSLLGTTDTAYPGDPDAVGVNEADIAGLLGFINKHLPTVHLKRSDVKAISMPACARWWTTNPAAPMAPAARPR